MILSALIVEERHKENDSKSINTAISHKQKRIKKVLKIVLKF